MKNFILLFIIFFGLASCQKTETTINLQKNDTSKIVKQPLQIDSIKIEDSASLSKNLKAVFGATALIFPTIKNKTLLDSIYSKEKINLPYYTKEELKKSLIKNKENYFAETKNSLKKYSPDSDEEWNRNSSMEVFNIKNDVLSLKYFGDGFTGGAHGYYYEFYKNFNLKLNKTYQLQDIFNTIDPKLWYPILLKNYLKSNEMEFLFDKNIPLTDNFYFDDTDITFVYNEYEIGPYAAGVFYIKIPFAEVSGKIKPEFKKEINLK